MRRLIEAEPDLKVCGEAETAREAKSMIREQEPDAVIVDVSLKQGDGLVAHVAQHPPQPCGVVAVGGVVGDYLHRAINAQPSEQRGHLLRRRHRVSAAPAGRLFRGRQVAVKVDVDRPGNMGLQIGPFASPGVGQIEATIEQRPIRMAQSRGQRIDIDQRLVGLSHA